MWEDNASAESRFRRVQQSAPTRGLPFEVDDPSDTRKGRFNARRTPWWRPTGTWGRVALFSGLLVGAGVFAYAYYEGKSFFEHDARFRIAGTTDIQAAGLTEVNRSQILTAFGEDIGRDIFFVPLSERRKQLEQIPWVQQATVMRLLPDQIRVSVVERQPVAFVRHGQQIGLVDANGVLLNMPPGLMSQHHYSFPVLTGIDAGDPLPSRRGRVDLYLRLMSELDSNGQHLSDQISEIDLTDPEDARVSMPEQRTDVLAHFGQDHFLERYQRYKAHIAEWRQQYPKLSAVDLRYEQQVVLEMDRGQANAQPVISAANATPVATKVINPPASISSPKPATSAKPDAGKRASVDPPSSTHAAPTHAAEIHAAKKLAVVHPVAPKHASGKAPAKASLKIAAAKRTKDKKHGHAKPAAQMKTKPSTKTHVSATAATGQ